MKTLFDFIFYAVLVVIALVGFELLGLVMGTIPATDHSMLSEFIRSIFNLF